MGGENRFGPVRQAAVSSTSSSTVVYVALVRAGGVPDR
jgi:hypothetical protein